MSQQQLSTRSASPTRMTTTTLMGRLERIPDSTATCTSSSTARGGLTPSSKSDISVTSFADTRTYTDTDSQLTPVSPPLSPIASFGQAQKRPEILGRRMKGKAAGLKLNETNLKKYTEYDTLGATPLSPFFTPPAWTPNTFGEPHGDIQSNLERLEEGLATPLPVFDVYALSTILPVFRDAAALARLRQFAEARGQASDVDLLLQIREYGQAVEAVSGILSNISQKYIGVAASEPVRLPLTVGKMLNNEMREISNSVMGGLAGTFDDTRASVEQSLAQEVYPDFLKSQLSLHLQVVGPGYSPNQVCPGFGEAFCMSDPNEADNPIVFASDGLACLTGYGTADMIARNSRLFQGPGTRGSCVDRMRSALAKHDEFAELVLNYTRDGRPYWNLVFMARLCGGDGVARYNLGGQVDVTEMVEKEEDVTQLLSYVSPLADRPSRQRGAAHAANCPSSSSHSSSPNAHEANGGAAVPAPAAVPAVNAADRRASWRGGFREKRQETSKYPPSTSRNKFLRGFRQRHSPAHSAPESSAAAAAGAPSNDSGTDLSLSEPPTPTLGLSSRDSPRKSIIFSQPSSSSSSCCCCSPSQRGHFSTVSPYSRFMVLEYIKPNTTNSTSTSTTTSSRGISSSSHDKKANRLQLPVAFCSTAALESLGQGHRSPGDVLGACVFDVLGDRAAAPSSVTKSFRATVRATLAEGRTVKQDISVGGSGHGHHSSSSHSHHSHGRMRGMSLSRKTSGLGLGQQSSSASAGGGGESPQATPGSRESVLRRTLSLERLVGHHGSSSAPSDNFVTYWTPLKDAAGAPRWVVVILVPELA